MKLVAMKGLFGQVYLKLYTLDLKKIYIQLSYFLFQYTAVYFNFFVWCWFVAAYLLYYVCIRVQQEASVRWGFIISINLNHKELDSPRVTFMALINKIL